MTPEQKAAFVAQAVGTIAPLLIFAVLIYGFRWASKLRKKAGDNF